MKSDKEIIVCADNIHLVSVNKRKLPRGRKVFLFDNPHYQRAKHELVKQFTKQAKRKIFSTSEMIKVQIYISTLKDIDNVIKIILDALQEVGIIKNDRYVLALQVLKISNIAERVVVRISEARGVIEKVIAVFLKVFG